MGLRPILSAFVITVGLARSQTARPEFAVASVKPNHAGCCTTYGAGNGGSGGKDVTLKMLIAFAYHLQRSSKYPADRVGLAPTVSMLRAKRGTPRQTPINCGSCCDRYLRIDST